MLSRKAFLKGAGGAALLGLIDPVRAATGDQMLSAGVAKVKLTPAPADLAALGGAVDAAGAQDIFARIILLANGSGQRLLLITADLPHIPQSDALLRQIASQHRIAPEACILAVTGNRQADALVAGTPQSATIEAAIMKAIVAGIGEAIATLAPARMALSFSESHINAPFGRMTAAGALDMPDFAQFADPRLALLRIDTLAGKTRALFVNYAMQSNMMQAATKALSGDVAGVISQWVERRLDCVCAWSMGAAASSYPLTTAALETPFYKANGSLSVEKATLSEELIGRLAAYLAAVQGLDIVEAHGRMKRFSTRFALALGERRFIANGRKGAVKHRLHMAVINQDFAIAGVNALASAELGRMVREAIPYRSLFLSSEGESIGIVVDQGANPDNIAGSHSVAADPWQSERLYVEGFASMAADAAKVA